MFLPKVLYVTHMEIAPGFFHTVFLTPVFFVRAVFLSDSQKIRTSPVFLKPGFFVRIPKKSPGFFTRFFYARFFCLSGFFIRLPENPLVTGFFKTRFVLSDYQKKSLVATIGNRTQFFFACFFFRLPMHTVFFLAQVFFSQSFFFLRSHQ